MPCTIIWTCWHRSSPRSPRGVLREDVVPRLHDGVAGEAAFRVVPLRRGVRRRSRAVCTRLGVVLEFSPSPAAAVREPVAVLDHEVDVMEGAGYEGLTGLPRLLLRVPMELGHPGAVGERLAVVGNAGLEGRDHRGVAED